MPSLADDITRTGPSKPRNTGGSLNWGSLFLFLLPLLTLQAAAQQRWKHKSLDMSFVMPAGWGAIQGPVMMELSPAKDMAGERRPSLKITWRQQPPAFDQFLKELQASIKEKAPKDGSVTYNLVSIGREDIASFPARSYHYKVVEKGHVFRTTLALVRLSKGAGYLITTETMEVDAKKAEPVFAKVISGLRLGLPRK